MKSTALLLPLILIFAIQFASVHTESITGTWSNPTITKSSSNICCIPDSITISSSFSGMIATYNVAAMYMNQQCLTLFGSVTSATIDLSYMGTDYYYGTKYSQMGMKTGYFYYEVASSGNLKVYTTSSYDQCDFTMKTKTGGGPSPSPNSGAGAFVFIVIFVIIICVIVSCANNKRKVSDGPVIIQPNLAQQNIIYNPAGTNVYSPQTTTVYVNPNVNANFQNNYAFANNAYVPPSNNGGFVQYGQPMVAPGDAAMAFNANQGNYAPSQPQFDANAKNYAPSY